MKKLLIIFLLISTYLYAANNKKEKVSIQLLWKHQFEFAGYYMAKEKGFYKELGLDVEIREFDFGINISDDVLAKKADFGVGRSSLILDKMNNKDVFLLYATFQKSPYVLVSKNKEDLKQVSDFKNKSIMVSQDIVTMTAINAMMKTNGVKQDDLKKVKHTFNMNDLINDKVDLVSIYSSNELFELKEKNISYRVFDPAEHGFNFYSDILFTSKELFKDNPVLVEKFYQASLRGWQYAFEHKEETAELILDKYDTQNKTKAHLLFEANILEQLSKIDGVAFGAFKMDIISQIAQTYKLLDITNNSLKKDDTSFIYQKALHKDNQFDYTLLWKILASLAVLFLALFYWNRKLSNLNAQIKKSKEQVSILLNNAGQGFLTFNKDFLINKEYSLECIKLLGNDLENKDITKLLFKDENKQKIFQEALKNAMNEEIQIKRNSYLSLLPPLIILNKRALKLEYKILGNDKCMLVITNITMEKKLEQKIKKEQETFKMIVAIVSETEVFYDVKKDYLEFISSYAKNIDKNKEALYNINNLYRAIHTFKGTFSQLYMTKVVNFLHKIESELSLLLKDNSKSNEKLLGLLSNIEFKKNFDETIKIIDDILGNEFLESENYLKVDMHNINELQEKIAKVMSEHIDKTPECEEILCQVQRLSSIKLSSMLKPYSIYSKQLAKRLDKEIYDFDILGDRNIEISLIYKPFIKSLIHVFRNCIDHGIEHIEDRLEKHKDEIGSISCNINLVGDTIHIIIADDGAGIDMEVLKQKAKKLNINTKNMHEDEILSLIFIDSFSTKEKVDDISGRGVGLASVKEECEKLNGKIKIFTKKDLGTTFEFILPR